MSDIVWQWSALACAVLLFGVMAWLHRSRHVNFSIRIVVATIMGVLVGVGFKGHLAYVAVVGDIWSNAIKAIVVPLLLFSVIASISGLAESVRLRHIGVKTVLFLLLNTFAAACVALALGLLSHVGKGFQWSASPHAQSRAVPGVLDTIVGLFPSNLVGDWAANQVVPIVLFALLIAVSLNEASTTPTGAKAVAPFTALANAGNVVFSKATQIVVGFTPYATLSLIAAAVSNSIVSTLVPLLGVLVVSYVALAIQLFIVQPLILGAAAHLNPIHFFTAFAPAGIVAFTSESSIGTIPVTVQQLKRSGVSEDVGSFVATLGANLGMPGCAGIWPVLLAVFAINSQGLNYTAGQYLLLIVFALLVSIGTVGVPGTATVTATALFAAAGLPAAFIAVTQPISQIVDMGRTAVNVAGAANTAYIVAVNEHELDEDLYYRRKGWAESDGELGRDGGNVDDAANARDSRAKSSDAAGDAADMAGRRIGDSGRGPSGDGASSFLSFTPGPSLKGTGGESCGIGEGSIDAPAGSSERNGD